MNNLAATQILVFVLCIFLPGIAGAQPTQSVYTSLEVKQCRTVKSVKEVGGHYYEGRCRGVAGYTLIITEGDLRQNVTVVTPSGAQHSLNLWYAISGGFSSLGPKAEWRMRKESGKLKPFALIIRFNASEDTEHPEKVTSYLAVAKITSKEICVTAKLAPAPNANEAARRAADQASSGPCLVTRE